MNLSVTGHHVEVTDALRDYVNEKMEKLRQQAEATIDLAGTKVHAEAESSDMYAAIDALTYKLDRQVLKHKEKLRDHHKREKFAT